MFNGQTFGVVLPIHAQLGWRVWRVGYEYDFLYKKYGFVGVVLEARYTELTASLQSPLTTAGGKRRTEVRDVVERGLQDRDRVDR